MQTIENEGECNMFENLIAALKADKRKIVFTEGPDARILEALKLQSHCHNLRRS